MHELRALSRTPCRIVRFATTRSLAIAPDTPKFDGIPRSGSRARVRRAGSTRSCRRSSSAMRARDREHLAAAQQYSGPWDGREWNAAVEQRSISALRGSSHCETTMSGLSRAGLVVAFPQRDAWPRAAAHRRVDVGIRARSRAGRAREAASAQNVPHIPMMGTCIRWSPSATAIQQRVPCDSQSSGLRSDYDPI